MKCNEMQLWMKLPLSNGKLFHCFNYENRWVFLLRHFCSVFSFAADSQARDYFRLSLQDFRAAFCSTTKQKRKKVFFEVPYDDGQAFLLQFVAQHSHRVTTDTKTNKLIRLDVEELKQHLIDVAQASVGETQQEEQQKQPPPLAVVDLIFFAEYLREMHTRWQQRRAALRLSEQQFVQHLIEKLQCPCWAHLLQNIQLLEPIARHYLQGQPPQQDRDKETDDLINYLNSFKAVQNGVAEPKTSIDDESSLHLIATTTGATDKQDAAIVPLSIIDATAKATTPTITTTATNTTSNIQSINRKRRKLTHRDRLAVASDQQWRCGWCQELLSDCFETDHIDEFHETGNDHHENLWAICANCHARKTELDRRRKKPHVWRNYVPPQNDTQREQRRKEIINKITNI